MTTRLGFILDSEKKRVDLYTSTVTLEIFHACGLSSPDPWHLLRDIW